MAEQVAVVHTPARSERERRGLWDRCAAIEAASASPPGPPFVVPPSGVRRMWHAGDDWVSPLRSRSSAGVGDERRRIGVERSEGGLRGKFQLTCVAAPHVLKSLVAVGVEHRRHVACQEGHERVTQVGTPGHPLEVVAPAVVVGTIEPAAREGLFEPPEHRLVTNMHAESYLGLTPVPSEVPFPYEEADQDSYLEFSRHSE